MRNDQNYMVRGMGLLHTVSDIENVVVSSGDAGVPIRVGDLAKVSIGAAIRKGQVGKNEDDDVVEGILLYAARRKSIRRCGQHQRSMG